MVKAAIGLGIALLASAVVSAPACAEHNTMVARDAARPGEDTALDLDLKVGRDGFRLGGRFLGPDGAHDAWLDGRVLPYGLVLDGRVQDERGAHTFKMKLDLEDLLPGRLRL
jgi:hypothetical protein